MINKVDQYLVSDIFGNDGIPPFVPYSMEPLLEILENNKKPLIRYDKLIINEHKTLTEDIWQELLVRIQNKYVNLASLENLQYNTFKKLAIYVASKINFYFNRYAKILDLYEQEAEDLATFSATRDTEGDLKGYSMPDQEGIPDGDGVNDKDFIDSKTKNTEKNTIKQTSYVQSEKLLERISKITTEIIYNISEYSFSNTPYLEYMPYNYV